MNCGFFFQFFLKNLNFLQLDTQNAHFDDLTSSEQTMHNTLKVTQLLQPLPPWSQETQEKPPDLELSDHVTLSQRRFL